jgi:hypothetical protein
VINGLQHVSEKWVERCKKCIACQGRYLEKRPLPHLHKVPTRSNKASPRTFQTSFVVTKHRPANLSREVAFQYDKYLERNLA